MRLCSEGKRRKNLAYLEELQKSVSVELIQFVSSLSLLKVEGLVLVSPLPEELSVLVQTLLPEGIQEPTIRT
jgi:hypothetical protein